MPGLKVWLDVDDLISTSDLEAAVHSSMCIIVFLSGSTHEDSNVKQTISDYFRSWNCKREFYAAAISAKDAPIVLVIETDPSKGGVPWSTHVNDCPESFSPSAEESCINMCARARTLVLSLTKVTCALDNVWCVRC